MTTTVSGWALHGGHASRVTLHRTEGPVRFRRAGVTIPARYDRVVASERCTVLGEGGARVALVEHLLAALRIAGFWRGVEIEAEADELPILDGSAAPWLEPIATLGAPPPAPAGLRPTRAFGFRSGASELLLEPGPERLCAEIHFDHPAIGHQRWCGGPDAYAELLDARTFGFLREAEALRASGLAGGASLENAIVFDGEGPLRPLRRPDEPVRHKALDALGDLFLLGRPLDAGLTVRRGSHRTHLDFMRDLVTHLDDPEAC